MGSSRSFLVLPQNLFQSHPFLGREFLLIEQPHEQLLALAFVLYLGYARQSAFVLADPAMCLTLAASGIVTCVPLLLFAAAARRLRFATLGFLQYLAPTIQFLIAVFVFKEPLTTVKIVSLSLIWTAVGIYSIDSLRMLRQHRLTAREAERMDPAPADV